ncbi:DUF3152 domain-containing protein [uncultured Pseudokineococcus sp.]|uniref:DUF3152 domain-containing protein n=1 Tax=uncultured Pseudokineococcus sp. TaxID=1642928 RepID=UPI002607BCC2|nr:DUF3152 domain-containing protein [uncultured Pseudokineococcus sp.]
MVSRRVVRRRRQVLAGGVGVLAIGTALALAGGGDEDRGDPGAAAPASSALPPPSTPEATGARVAGATGGPDGEAPPDARPGVPAEEVRPAGADERAGVLSAEVPDAGTGRLVTVPGTAPAAEGGGDGQVVQVRVQVEEGLPADGAAVAGTVMDVLQDPRGWGPDGWAFARTDDAAGSPAADVTVVLASPRLTDELCAPLRTGGVLSCRDGERAVLTWYRWAGGAEAYGEDREGYRRYLVSHEVGHFLGHGHEPCGGPGEPAPVMLQQTKGLDGCSPQPWPHP